MKPALPIICALIMTACGQPEGMETREEFDIRMEEAERARQATAARQQQAEIEESLRNASEQEEIRAAVEAAAAAAIGLGGEEGEEGEESEEGELDDEEAAEVQLEEVRAFCGRSDPRCIVRTLEGRARTSDALELLADAYAQIGNRSAERRTRARLRARLVVERTR